MSWEEENEPKEAESSALKALKAALGDQELSDVTLVGLDGVEVPASRITLGMRSKVFRKMLVGSYEEANQSKVKISGYNGAVLRAVVEFCYTDDAELFRSTGDAKNKAIPTMVSLADAADYFDLPELRKKVLTFIETIYEPALSCGFLEESITRGDSASELVKAALVPIRKRPRALLEYEGLSRISSFAVQKILGSNMHASQQTKFKILCAWVGQVPTNESHQATASAAIAVNDDDCMESTDYKSRFEAAADLCRNLKFEVFAPSDLYGMVASAGFVPSDRLQEALKKITLRAERELGKEFFEKPSARLLQNHVLVEGAGISPLNGRYQRTWDFEGALQFKKEVVINGHPKIARLFRCTVNNNTKHWFISIVPDKIMPGTNKDRDFYSAPAPSRDCLFPPRDGWMKQVEGREPAPTVALGFDRETDSEDSDEGDLFEREIDSQDSDSGYLL